MERKGVQLEWKADPSGTIEGYGSIFGNVDDGGDIVQRGAFKASLKAARGVKMLRDHDTRSLVGVWDELKEDGTGLRVKGRLILTVAAAKEAHDLILAGAMDGLSIGYRTTKAAYNKDGHRVIQEADLWEVSLVTFPMNAMTVIDAVKAAELSKQELEARLTHDAGLSRSVARRLMAGGFDAVKSMRGAGDGFSELADALRDRVKLGHAKQE